MKHKIKDLPKFYAFYHEFNGNQLVAYNVITESLIQDLDKVVGKKYYNFRKSKYEYLDSREKFIEQLDSEFMYRYWSKSEWEFICSNWTGKKFEQKVDVYAQLKPNIEVIADLIIQAMDIDWNKIKEKCKK